MENHYVKIWHVRLMGANNMRPLSWGGVGGGWHKRKRSNDFVLLIEIKKIIFDYYIPDHDIA